MTASQRTTTTAATRTRRRHRKQAWVVVGALAGAAAVGAFSVLTVGLGLNPLRTLLHQAGGSSSSAALTVGDVRSWTATTTTFSDPADAEPLHVRCLRSLADPKDPTLDPADVTANNLEQRGTVTSLIASGGPEGKRVWCLATTSGLVSAELIDTSASRLPSLPAGDVNLQTFGGNGSDNTATMSAYGQVGTDVTSLTVTLPGAPAATASVQDGLWSLWWPAPGMTSLPDLGDVQLAWTTADGAHHDGTGTELVWSAAQ
jgi:hypothetical protein